TGSCRSAWHDPRLRAARPNTAADRGPPPPRPHGVPAPRPSGTPVASLPRGRFPRPGTDPEGGLHMAAERDDTTDPQRDPRKTVDLPPYGPRNPDPVTDAPGSHPIETGIGAAIGGAASGLAVGTLTAGPIGAVA